MLDPSISGCSWWPYEQHELALMFKCIFFHTWPAKSFGFGSCPWCLDEEDLAPTNPIQLPGCRVLQSEAADLWVCWLLTAHWCSLWLFGGNAYELYGSACNNQSFKGEEGLAIVSVLQTMYNVEVATFVRCPTKAYSNSATPWWSVDVTSGLHKCPLLNDVRWC